MGQTSQSTSSINLGNRKRLNPKNGRFKLQYQTRQSSFMHEAAFFNPLLEVEVLDSALKTLDSRAHRSMFQVKMVGVLGQTINTRQIEETLPLCDSNP